MYVEKAFFAELTLALPGKYTPYLLIFQILGGFSYRVSCFGVTWSRKWVDEE